MGVVRAGAAAFALGQRERGKEKKNISMLFPLLYKHPPLPERFKERNEALPKKQNKTKSVFFHTQAPSPLPNLLCLKHLPQRLKELTRDLAT